MRAPAVQLYMRGMFPTADGKANLIAVEHAEPVEEPDARLSAGVDHGTLEISLAHDDAHR